MLANTLYGGPVGPQLPHQLPVTTPMHANTYTHLFHECQEKEKEWTYVKVIEKDKKHQH